MKNIIVKSAILFMLSLFLLSSLVSCSNNDRQLICAHPWESMGSFYEFKESGKICCNFESEDDAVSYYKLLSGNRINMYTQEGEDTGFIFNYSFRDGKLYIGNAEYKKAEKIDLESIEKELLEKNSVVADDGNTSTESGENETASED